MALVAEAIHHYMYETVFPFNLAFAVWCGLMVLLVYCFTLWITTLIAWRRHLLGGILIVLSSSIYIICVSLLGRLHVWMFFWFVVPVLFLLGGLLHLFVWWRERNMVLETEV